jgi:hypothetical protein
MQHLHVICYSEEVGCCYFHYRCSSRYHSSNCHYTNCHLGVVTVTFPSPSILVIVSLCWRMNRSRVASMYSKISVCSPIDFDLKFASMSFSSVSKKNCCRENSFKKQFFLLKVRITHPHVLSKLLFSFVLHSMWFQEHDQIRLPSIGFTLRCSNLSTLEILPPFFSCTFLRLGTKFRSCENKGHKSRRNGNKEKLPHPLKLSYKVITRKHRNIRNCLWIIKISWKHQ